MEDKIIKQIIKAVIRESCESFSFYRRTARSKNKAIAEVLEKFDYEKYINLAKE